MTVSSLERLGSYLLQMPHNAPFLPFQWEIFLSIALNQILPLIAHCCFKIRLDTLPLGGDRSSDGGVAPTLQINLNWRLRISGWWIVSLMDAIKLLEIEMQWKLMGFGTLRYADDDQKSWNPKDYPGEEYPHTCMSQLMSTSIEDVKTQPNVNLPYTAWVLLLKGPLSKLLSIVRTTISRMQIMPSPLLYLLRDCGKS